MEALKRYLKTLPADEREPFAIRCGTTLGYLTKAISKRSKLGPALTVRIEEETDGAVSRRDLHPNDWAAIWPELRETV